jgi:hypothetical protein
VVAPDFGDAGHLPDGRIVATGYTLLFSLLVQERVFVRVMKIHLTGNGVNKDLAVMDQ